MRFLVDIMLGNGLDVLLPLQNSVSLLYILVHMQHTSTVVIQQDLDI